MANPFAVSIMNYSAYVKTVDALICAHSSIRRSFFGFLGPENTKKVIDYLVKHPLVEKVYHPSLPDHPDHAL